MRSTFALAAGFAAVAAAKQVTSTVTEDVTITYCPPEVTGCPYGPDGGANWSDWDDPATTTSTADGSDPTWADWESTATVTSKKPSGPATTADPADPADPAWSDWDSATGSVPYDPATTASDYDWADWSSSTGSVPNQPVTTGTDAASTWADWVSGTPVGPGTPAGPATTAAPVAPEGCGKGPDSAPAWLSLIPADKSSSIAAKWTSGAPADWCYYTYSPGLATSPVAPAGPKGSDVSPVGGSASSVVAPYGGPTGASDVKPSQYTGAASSNAGSFAVAGLAAVAAMVL